MVLHFQGNTTYKKNTSVTFFSLCHSVCIMHLLASPKILDNQETVVNLFLSTVFRPLYLKWEDSSAGPTRINTTQKNSQQRKRNPSALYLQRY